MGIKPGPKRIAKSTGNLTDAKGTTSPLLAMSPLSNHIFTRKVIEIEN